MTRSRPSLALAIRAHRSFRSVEKPGFQSFGRDIDCVVRISDAGVRVAALLIAGHSETTALGMAAALAAIAAVASGARLYHPEGAPVKPAIVADAP
jgi:hypothetical protein